ncbi:MAG: putative transport protein MmpL2 [candidate division WS2 bacterium]|uniref:Transport protein MmpL2 n=1 Tax=Psychracetigena formicireducens TaxID=2986056 RepID=A0A9E2F1B9_PSYF1|nr:putative transport protein MmpL2 [Candidatus Psychracetigena formicireducens]MBT9145289.1 putative transport protein MmpL2 [Candidatus Psychracetigena formicireducens]MBT9150340.1 putative transport protein MmpL2 [Candidatus Psychracetigena formicireducens]
MAKLIVKYHKAILIFTLLISIIPIYGFFRVSIEIAPLYEYLPKEFESIQGRELFTELMPQAVPPDAFILITSDKLLNIETLSFIGKFSEEIRKVKGVDGVVAITDFLPAKEAIFYPDALPQEITDRFLSENLKSTVVYIDIPVDKQEGKIQTYRSVINNIREVINRLETEKPEGVKTYLSGLAGLYRDVIEVTEEDRQNIDLIAITTIGIALVSVLLSLWMPVAVGLVVGLAILWNLGLCYWWPGTMTILVFMGTVSIQLGVTVDYGIFISSRYREERTKNEDNKIAMEVALSKVSRAIMGASITTILGFGSLSVARLGVISEFGLVIARGILLSLLMAMFVFPSILLISNGLVERLSLRGFKDRR